MEIKYPYIPQGQSISYVDISDPFMTAARKEAQTHSTDISISTGAVIVKDGAIVARGANQSTLKSPKALALHKKYCIRRLLGIPSGKYYFLCPGCASHKNHGEFRTVLDGQKHGIDMHGTDLYLWGHWWCCKPCWDKMLKAGITKVFLLLGSEILFNISAEGNIVGKQFE